jgi:NADH dehydrogenase
MTKTIGITGANGFIGKAIIQAYLDTEHKVIAYVRQYPIQPIEGVQYILFDLGKDYPNDFFKPIDILIHLAFNFKPTFIEGEDINTKMANFIQKSKIPYLVFISSFAAANPITESYYGLTKSKLEKIFSKDLIVRPSLVLGDGGLYNKIQNQLKRLPIVPIFNKGQQTIQTIYIDDLVKSIVILIKNQKKGTYHISHSESIPYKYFMKIVGQSVQKRLLFVPIPIMVLKALIKILAWISYPVINKDNLAGILNSKHINSFHDEQEIGFQWLDVKQSISRIRSK